MGGGSLEAVSRYRDTQLQVMNSGEQLVIRGYTGANKNTECLLQSTSVF